MAKIESRYGSADPTLPSRLFYRFVRGTRAAGALKGLLFILGRHVHPVPEGFEDEARRTGGGDGCDANCRHELE